MIVAIVGQPNSGKSTLFNAVAGYRTIAANFPGTTIEATRTNVLFEGEEFDLVDLPGIYSLSAASGEESHAVDALLSLKPDVVIHLADASVLCRSLELTIQLLELEVPLVVGLNMMDEAQRKGMLIDAMGLQDRLGVPVVPLVARRGEGISALFHTALAAARRGVTARCMGMSRDVESLVGRLAARIDPRSVATIGLPARLIALKLLELDERVEATTAACAPELLHELRLLREQLADAHGRPPDVVISSERHALSMNLAEQVSRVRDRRRESGQDQVDRLVMHPVWGSIALAAVLLGFFYVVFGLGRAIEAPLVAGFSQLGLAVKARLAHGSLWTTIVGGILDGLAGGIAIVLPYLVPFLAGMAILEDFGYVPRAAFLMDALMHRIGLHGKAVIPLVLGYGCSVPAILGARVMESPRDRFVTAFLASFIPCAARTTIVFALIGYFVGPLEALGFYVLNAMVIVAVGRLLLRLYPAVSPGLILEIPPYRLPEVRTILRKVWFRLREFIVVAWPILIAGSMVLSLLDHFSLSGMVNALLAPVTHTLLGLPPGVGVSLVFGLLRKELTIVMLGQALGTTDFGSVLTRGQMCVYTAFILFYVPCLATLAALRTVVGLRATLVVALLTTATAVSVGVLFRLAFALFS
jgi:ferrous iron transport protein B